MTPIKGVPLDAIAFEKLRKIAPNLLAARRERLGAGRSPLAIPDEVAFKLTNRCDLRCTHCYQWGPNGYHHHLPRQQGDLDIAIIDKVLQATSARRSNVYLWGGEPLVYRHWDELATLLQKHQRWTSICTNGTLIARRLPTLEALSDHVEVSISLDGQIDEHDALRGIGAFQKATTGIALLTESRDAGRFRGEITVNYVLSAPMIGKSLDFIEFLAARGVDTVYVSLPWFISTATARKMDVYYDHHFHWRPIDRDASWNSYDFAIDEKLVQPLADDIHRLSDSRLPVKVRFNPRVDADELLSFLRGSDIPAQNKTHCESIHTRMDVFPGGDVVSCKFFPEMTMGNLTQASVEDVWHGERFQSIRRTTDACGLMPICAKCNLLYARGS